MSTATASGWWGIRWHFHFNFYLSFQNKKRKHDKKAIVKTFNKEKEINDILINKLYLPTCPILLLFDNEGVDLIQPYEIKTEPVV